MRDEMRSLVFAAAALAFAQQPLGVYGENVRNSFLMRLMLTHNVVFSHNVPMSLLTLLLL